MQAGDAERRTRLVLAFAREVGGAHAVRIVRSLGDGATEDVIARNTSLDIPLIRTTLNRLYEAGGVEYTRSKNTQTGWYTYTWRVNEERALQNYFTLKKRRREQLLAQLRALDGAVIYTCRSRCTTLPFEAAEARSFKCPRCRGLLKWSAGEAESRRLREEIQKIEELLQSMPSAQS